jgi:hypothetical protein
MPLAISSGVCAPTEIVEIKNNTINKTFKFLFMVIMI